jgi:hypothetical protein
VAQGLPPSEFWDQSPRSFVAIMDGCARAAKRQSDAMLSQAWHTEAFARQKRLKPLREILGIKTKAQSPDEMLAVLRAIHGRGVPMNFKQVN